MNMICVKNFTNPNGHHIFMSGTVYESYPEESTYRPVGSIYWYHNGLLEYIIGKGHLVPIEEHIQNQIKEVLS